jgi:peptidoglycan/LPS O-acetylase OafA/YrhL
MSGALAGFLRTHLVDALTEPHSHLRVLTGIRGWAALWVFLYHVWGLARHPSFEVELAGMTLDFTPLAGMGGVGVTIFFVLSGFLLATPFAEWQAGIRPRPLLGRFVLRRVVRVFPAYYAQLAILLLIAAQVPGQPGISDAGVFVRHLFMLFNPPPLGTSPINGVWWTLPIEFSFYLALPFLAGLLKPGRWWLLLAGSLAAMYLWRHGVVVGMADASVGERVVASYQLPGSMDSFGIGMLAAMLQAHCRGIRAWIVPWTTPGRLGLLGLLLILAAIYWLPGRRAEYWSDHLVFYTWTPALALGIGAVILAAVNGSRLMQWLFGNRFMVYAGLVSYSYYLWHFPIMDWIAATDWFQSLAAGRFLWLLLVATPAVFLVATLSYLLVERPGMRLGRR